MSISVEFLFLAYFKLPAPVIRLASPNIKDGLKKASHIPDLEQHLNTIDFTQISAVKRERQVQALDAILAKLAKAEKQVSKTKAETQQLLVNGFSSFNNTMNSLNNAIASHVSQFNSI